MNPALLDYLGLPKFSTIAELSELMHFPYGELRKYAIHASKGYYYKQYFIRKPNGKYREINQPKRDLKSVQAWILRHILDRLNPSNHATAFRSGRSTFHNVLPHTDNRYFLCLDLKDFFPSVTKKRVQVLFETIGYSIGTADILASLCTCKRSLPQGGVTSPSLSNLVTVGLDKRIAGYAAKHNLVYTRYADDITLSCNNPKKLGPAKNVLKSIIGEEGFEVNHEKTSRCGPRQKCEITGLVKNSSQPTFSIGRAKKRELRAAIYSIVVKGSATAKYSNPDSVDGWLAYLKSVDPQAYQKLSAYKQKLIKAMA